MQVTIKKEVRRVDKNGKEISKTIFTDWNLLIAQNLW